MSYATGYSGTVRTLAELEAWSGWQGIDPEMRRRLLALMDASNVAGRPVGIGGSIRTVERQTALFLSRHHVVLWGGCCTYQGKRYALNSGVAHAAPPGRSYHEPVTTQGKCLAVDMIGDMRWLHENTARFGLFDFTNFPGNNEPWHVQPLELPRGRSQYNPTTMALRPFPLPGTTTPPAPTKVYAPRPDIRQGANNDAAQVRNLQTMCNFWGWRDAMGRTLVVDGDYGQRSTQACIAMQRALGFTGKAVDGWYGKATAAKLQAFLDYMAAL